MQKVRGPGAAVLVGGGRESPEGTPALSQRCGQQNFRDTTFFRKDLLSLLSFSLSKRGPGLPRALPSAETPLGNSLSTQDQTSLLEQCQ